MKTAYSYIRFSSKKQEYGDSLRRQIEATFEYCKKNDLILSKKNFQDLGISGFKEVDRPSLHDMLTAIENNEIKPGDVIILEQIDRISRRGIDTVQDLVGRILRAGVEIVSLQDGLHLTKGSLNDLISVVRLVLSADLAHKESLKKSERVLAAKNRQRKEAAKGKVINKRLAYWLKREGENYVFNDNIEVILLIVQKRKEGKGFHRIAIELNQTDYKPRYGGKWTDQTIREWVKSRALYGSYQTGSIQGNKFVAGELISNYFPQVISYDEWKSIQPNIVKRTGGHGKHNHLAGIVRCGHCGGAMHKKISKRKTKARIIEYKHWLCVKNKNGGCEFSEGIRDLDLIVFKSTSKLKLERHGTKDEQLQKLEQRRDELKSRIELFKAKLSTVPESIFSDVVSSLDSVKRDYVSIQEQLLERKDKNVNSFKEKAELLSVYKNDPVQFNYQLKQVVEVIEVRKKSKGVWHIKILQRNLHNLNITAMRKNQRSEFKYFFSSTEQIVEAGK